MRFFHRNLFGFVVSRIEWEHKGSDGGKVKMWLHDTTQPLGMPVVREELSPQTDFNPIHVARIGDLV